MSETVPGVAALLLTGGASTRMGRDKSQLIVEGAPLARRTATLLQRVVDVAWEVGPGVSGLPFIREELLGGGPLVAIAAGWRALRNEGHGGAALIVACDLPFLNEALLRLLAEWDATGSVVPVVASRPQPLLAKWGRDDLDDADELVRGGVRSLKHLTTRPDVTLLNESTWSRVANEATFVDVDSPEDLRRLGLTF